MCPSNLTGDSSGVVTPSSQTPAVVAATTVDPFGDQSISVTSPRPSWVIWFKFCKFWGEIVLDPHKSTWAIIAGDEILIASNIDNI